MKRLSYSDSSSVFVSCFDLLHVDIWGPLGTSSVFGHKYFLTIVDNNARFTWLFFMKLKSKARLLLQSSVKLILVNAFSG